MGQIVTLDQNMINMIAAGEVIERPASVVKELMENSIDAGATDITVSVDDGGRKLVSVTDNGCGMDADDINRAFEPHTTSKIKTSDDLLGISTLGFRGEALASIASVARVRLVSRTPDSHQGHSLEIDCGDKGSVSPCSASVGTSIEIRDIFYKLPARRKFLRTANTELGHISEQFARIALGCSSGARSLPTDSSPVDTGLSLTLIHKDRELHRLSAGMPIAELIRGLFPTLSDDPSQDFLRSHSIEKGLSILALLGKPAISRTSNKFQYTFLNGRFIRDRFISHAIKEAYRGLLEPNRFPAVFLFIQMPAEDFDVNVHPTKTEVRFFNSNLVHSQIMGCLREKLLGTDLGLSATLPAASGAMATANYTETTHRAEKITDAMAEFFKRHRPSHTQQQFGFQPGKTAGAGSPVASPLAMQDAATHYQSDQPDLVRNFMQIHDSFIVAQTDEGFVIIDQHALHERVIYETLRNRMNAGSLESQKLLVPASFEVTRSQAAVVEQNAESIRDLGIELAPFGPNTVAIQSFPSLLSKVDPVDFVRDMLDMLENAGQSLSREDFLDSILNMAACKAAIKAGQKLEDSEIDQLIAHLDSTDCSSRCPHGRPTSIKFTISDLEKQFKRT